MYLLMLSAMLAGYLLGGAGTTWLRYYIWGVAPRLFVYVFFATWIPWVLVVVPIAILVRFGLISRNVCLSVVRVKGCTECLAGCTHHSDMIETRRPAPVEIQAFLVGELDDNPDLFRHYQMM